MGASIRNRKKQLIEEANKRLLGEDFGMTAAVTALVSLLAMTGVLGAEAYLKDKYDDEYESTPEKVMNFFSKLLSAKEDAKEVVKNESDDEILKNILTKLDNSEVLSIVDNYEKRFGGRELSHNDLQTFHSKIKNAAGLSDDEFEKFKELSDKVELKQL